MSVKFVSEILGPEMAAPILWTTGKMPSFCRKTLHVHKIPRFGGGGGDFGFGGGGGSANFIFMGVGVFLIEIAEPKSQEFPPNRCLGQLKSQIQIARFVI